MSLFVCVNGGSAIPIFSAEWYGYRRVQDSTVLGREVESDQVSV